MAAAKGNGLDSEGGSVKKPRTVFTPKQLLHLEEEFVKNQFPSMEQRKQIAKDLDLTQQHIQIWFQNRRAKKRRKKKRHSEEEKMRRDPKPPPFWPSNLPFSSSIGDITKKQSPEDSPSTPTLLCPGAQAANDAASSTNGRDSPHSNTAEQSPSSESLSEHANGSSPARPSHLPCNSQDVPLSPALALTPGNGHPQLPTPPPHVSPMTSLPATGNFVDSPIANMMRQSSTDMVMSPPGGLGLHDYPPLPPPESLLAGSFREPSSYSSTAVSPMCNTAPLHSLHSLSAQGKIPPPPYSFSTKHSSSSLASSNMLSTQLPSYNLDPPSSSNNAFLSLSNSSQSLSPPKTTISLNNGPSTFSPTTLSPITNSDCSLTEASPLTKDVTLPAPETFPSAPSTSCQNDVLSLQDEGPSFLTRLASVSSPIHAKDPVVLTDLQEKEWELYSLCPVIQTEHDIWAANPPQMLANSSKGSPPLSASTAESPQQFSAMYGYFPYYNSGSQVGSQCYPGSSVSNGAK